MTDNDTPSTSEAAPSSPPDAPSASVTPPPRKRNHTLRWVIAIVIVAGGIWMWEEVLEDRLIPKRFGVVEAGQIYRSGQLHAALVKDVLVEHDIKVIVDLTGVHEGDANQAAEEQAAQELGIEHHRYPLSGNGTGDPTQYLLALLRVEQAVESNAPVLVHCAAGSQRSGGVVALHRVLVQGWTTREAIDEMLRYDWKHKDTALTDYLNEHVGMFAHGLVEAGVIDEAPDPLPVFTH